jgi:hypothetical protein
MNRVWSFLWYTILRYIILGLFGMISCLGKYLDYIITPLIYYTRLTVENLVLIVYSLTYLLGVIFTVGILAVSVLLFTYIVLTEIGVSIPKLQVYYEIATRIVDHKSTWAAVTTIVGTTVALSHLKNLEVNRARHRAEMRDRWKAEEEERQKRLDTYRRATRPL